MPIAEATTEQTPQETFASFRTNRGGSVEPVTVEKTSNEQQQKNSNEQQAAETGETPNPESAPASEPEKQEQSKFEKRVAEKQRRIDELTRQERELERRIAERSRSSETEAPKQNQPPAPASAAFDGTDPNDKRPEKPDPSKYTDWVKYEADNAQWMQDEARWLARKEFRVMEHERAQKAAQEESQRIYQESLQSFEDRGSEYAAEHDDYPELVKQFKERTISNEVACCILEAENGPAILHHLMLNPEEMRRIEAMKFGPKRTDAIYALKYKLLGYGKTEESKTAPQEKPKSAAPAPGTRLQGTGGSGSKEPTTFAQFRKQRSA